MNHAVCLVDTSVFVEILGVRGKSSEHDAFLRELAARVADGEIMVLPLATIFETGNHIAQQADGTSRLAIASRFSEEVRLAVESSGSGVFALSIEDELLPKKDFLACLDSFPSHAITGVSFGDLTITNEFERVCALNQGRRVYIWSLDSWLASHDRPAQI